jgi:hypothetical protein
MLGATLTSGAVAQLGERRPCKAEVDSSILFSSTHIRLSICFINGRLVLCVL